VKTGIGVFIAAAVALGASWAGLVLAPSLQLGNAKLTTVLNSTDAYPLQRPGMAAVGLQVYRANGCAACHTQQVQQDGSTFEVALTGAGKDPVTVSNLVATLKLTGLTKEAADAAAATIGAAGGKTETHLTATGADIARGWGTRHSVAADYLYDAPVQPGSLRAGPDLANIGVRAADANWQLVHLYAPRAVVKDSTMPSFAYLFEVRPVGAMPSAEALKLPAGFTAPAGFEVVPTMAAKQLAAYLLSLRSDAPLYEAPYSQTAKP